MRQCNETRYGVKKYCHTTEANDQTGRPSLPSARVKWFIAGWVVGYRLSGVSQTWRCVSGRAVCHRPGGVSQAGRCVSDRAVCHKLGGLLLAGRCVTGRAVCHILGGLSQAGRCVTGSAVYHRLASVKQACRCITGLLVYCHHMFCRFEYCITIEVRVLYYCRVARTVLL